MSIADIAKIAITVYNNKLKIRYDSSKPNGQYRKDAIPLSFSQIKDFKFKTLKQGIGEIYDYYK